jgi:type I restriction enzyme, S subunit
VTVHVVPIGDIVEKVATWNPAKQADSEFDYIDLSAIDQNDKRITKPNRMPTAEAPSRARQIIRTGDVLVSTVRPNLNGVAKAVDEHDGMTASTGFCVLRPRLRQLDPNYLFQWVRSPSFVGDMVRKATGASYPAVSDRIIKDSEIPLPLLREQKRIAAILDKADQLRQKRRQAIALLDSLTQSIFLEMFGDPISNPHGFESIVLDDLVDRKRGISYGIVQRGDEFPGGVQVLRIGDILDGEVRTDGLVRTDPEIASKFQRTKLLGGEMVISIRGTVGRCAVVPKTLANANVSREIAVIPSLELERNEFHLALLRTDSAQRRLKDDVKGVAQSGINLEDLRKLPVIRPPLHMVEKFLLMCSKLSAQRSRLKLCDDLGDKAFSSLQHRAFSGQL